MMPIGSKASRAAHDRGGSAERLGGAEAVVTGGGAGVFDQVGDAAGCDQRRGGDHTDA